MLAGKCAANPEIEVAARKGQRREIQVVITASPPQLCQRFV
jgi:hypothetical protein